jgi:hypothetical protein
VRCEFPPSPVCGNITSYRNKAGFIRSHKTDDKQSVKQKKNASVLDLPEQLTQQAVSQLILLLSALFTERSGITRVLRPVHIRLAGYLWHHGDALFYRTSDLTQITSNTFFCFHFVTARTFCVDQLCTD